MEPTRIVLIDMSPLLREIVREIVVREPDLEIVSEREAMDDEAIERDEADFVIVGRDAAGDESVRSLVGAGLGVRVLEVRSDGKESVLYELQPRRISLGEISANALLCAIRAKPSWDGKA